MVQDEVWTGHTLPAAHHSAHERTRTESLLATHDGQAPSDGQALPTLGAPAADHGPAAWGAHPLTKAVAPLTASIVGLKRSFHGLVPGLGTTENMQVIKPLEDLCPRPLTTPTNR
jgi:hypothetical protein